MPMAFHPDIHHRRSVRLRQYDYTRPGAYFVTVCTRNRECLFGDVVEGLVRLNERGKIVHAEWSRTESMRSNVGLDAFVVMPNHVHGIIVITDVPGIHVGAQRAAPLRTRGITPKNIMPGSLGAIVRSFKSAATRRINGLRESPGVPAWQRNYYEHIIRGDGELNRIREYIAANPAGWAEDENHPGNVY